MAVRMTQEIEKNVVDPSLRAWVLPTFSTTTAIDTTVFAVIMMATLKTYFCYTFMFICGIPRVTLEGEKSDWVRILERLEKLKEYGIHMIAWYHLLYPVISRLVAAFDAPDSPENVDFWQRVARHDPGGGCGLIHDFYSGWITAFYVFSKEGRWIGDPLNMVGAYFAYNAHPSSINIIINACVLIDRLPTRRHRPYVTQRKRLLGHLRVALPRLQIVSQELEADESPCLQTQAGRHDVPLC
jgi:hypothetical protein